MFDNGWLTGLQAAMLPTACLLCGDAAGAVANLCDGCVADLPRIDNGCDHCGLALTGAAVCGECLRRPPPYQRTHCAFRYEQPVSHLVHLLKFKRKLSAAHALGTLMARGFAEADRPQMLVPVPLYRDRLRARGFNQALELARPLSRALCVPIGARMARRVRPTVAQSELPDRASRRRNLRHAFEAGRSTDELSHVAIVDDVMTTGTTVAELARCLRRAGIERVDVWVCTRAC